jgi:hypothetical protein
MLDNLGMAGSQFEAGGLEFSSVPQYEQVQQLIKAITAGDTKGGAVTGLNSGPSLKLESLESTLKTLSYQMKMFTLYNMIGKKKAYSTAEEYNKMDNYGSESAYFIGEGELPESHDSQYQREVGVVKYMGTTRQVTDVAMRVRSQVPNLILQEEKNGMLYLGKGCDNFLFHGNEAVVPKQFNGMYYNHRVGLVGTTGTNLAYKNSDFVVDLKGYHLQEGDVNKAISAVVNQGYGLVTDIVGPPSVFNDFATSKYDIRRTGEADIRKGVYGNKIMQFVTQFGDVNVQNDIFARKSLPRYAASGKVHAKSPEAITPDGAIPLVANVDTYNQFLAAYAGDYFVAVASINEYGEGPLTALSAAVVSVGADDSIDMKFTIVNGSYPATGFVIYRSEKNPTTALADTPLYPIFKVTAAEHAAGYDGSGVANITRDRNYEIPNTESCFVIENNSDQVFSLKELSPMMKMDLALTSPTYRFMILYYIVNLLYAPKKMAVIKNIGKLTPA